MMRGDLERLLPLSLQFPHAWEKGESPVCLGYIPYFVLANLRAYWQVWRGWRQRAELGAVRNHPLLPNHL